MDSGVNSTRTRRVHDICQAIKGARFTVRARRRILPVAPPVERLKGWPRRWVPSESEVRLAFGSSRVLAREIGATMAFGRP